MITLGRGFVKEKSRGLKPDSWAVWGAWAKAHAYLRGNGGFSVAGGWVDVVDDHDIDDVFALDHVEAEFAFEGGLEDGDGVGPYVGWSVVDVRGEVEGEVVGASEACLVDEWSADGVGEVGGEFLQGDGLSNGACRAVLAVGFAPGG